MKLPLSALALIDPFQPGTNIFRWRPNSRAYKPANRAKIIPPEYWENPIKMVELVNTCGVNRGAAILGVTKTAVLQFLKSHKLYATCHHIQRRIAKRILWILRQRAKGVKNPQYPGCPLYI